MRVRRVEHLPHHLVVEGHRVVPGNYLWHKAQDQAGDEDGKDLIQNVRGKALQDDGQALVLENHLVELGEVLWPLAWVTTEGKDEYVHAHHAGADAYSEAGENDPGQLVEYPAASQQAYCGTDKDTYGRKGEIIGKVRSAQYGGGKPRGHAEHGTGDDGDDGGADSIEEHRHLRAHRQRAQQQVDGGAEDRIQEDAVRHQPMLRGI